MKIYIDSDFKCHASAAQGLRAFELPDFDGKCPRFVEGYRYVPKGESWQREDGAVFRGEMLAPVEDHSRLQAAQQVYEVLKEELEELWAKLREIRDCIDGLASNPSLEQLIDFIRTIRELIED